MNLNRTDIVQLLVSKWEYKESQVMDVVDKLMALPQDLTTSFEQWMATGILPEVPIIRGLSPRYAYERFKLKPPAIFLLLDWLYKDPEEALQALKEEFSFSLPATSDNASASEEKD